MKKHFIWLIAILLTAVVVVSGTNKKRDDGFTNASFNGTYKKVLLGYESSSGMSKSAITDMIFDGEGEVVVGEGFMSVSIPDGANLPVGGNTGTYFVNPDGSYTFSFGGGVVGQLYEDTKSYIHTKVNNSNSQVIVAGIKTGNSGYTDASFNGTYKRVGFAIHNGTPVPSLADVTLDGNGNVHIEGINSTPEGIIPINMDGTYIVEDDGSFTFTFGGSLMGQLHEDSKSYIGAKIDNNNTQMIVVGVKIGKKGFNNARMKGVYRRVMFGFNNDGPWSSIADLTFDGKENVSMEGVKSSPAGANEPISGAWKYFVSPDGSFKFIYPSGGEALGQLHEDKKSFIAVTGAAIIIGTKLEKKRKKEKKEK